jgi:hypothetical protein
MPQKPKPKPKPKPGNNRPFKDKSGWGSTPFCIYYYYLTPDQNGGFYVEAYYYDEGAEIPKSELRSRVEMLTQNAMLKWPTRQPCGWDFSDLRWRRLSYLVIALNDPNRKLEGDKAIEFDVTTPNHTFLDGDTMVVEPETGVKISVAYCINHMSRNSTGDPLEVGSQEFRFRLNGLNRAWSDDGGSGTNMGPPVPPPSRRRKSRPQP